MEVVRLSYKDLLQKLICCVDDYTFSRVVQVTPKFEKFINDVESIRVEMNDVVDTTDDGK